MLTASLRPPPGRIGFHLKNEGWPPAPEESDDMFIPPSGVATTSRADTKPLVAVPPALWEQFFKEQRSALWGIKKKLRAAAGALAADEEAFLVAGATRSKAAMKSDIMLLTRRRLLVVGDGGRVLWQVRVDEIADAWAVGTMQVALSAGGVVEQFNVFPTARIPDLIAMLPRLRAQQGSTSAIGSPVRVPLAAGATASGDATATRDLAERWFSGQLSVMGHDRPVADFVEEFYAPDAVYTGPSGGETRGRDAIAAMFSQQLREVSGGRAAKTVAQLAVSPAGDFAVVQSQFEVKTLGRVREGAEVSALHFDGNRVVAQMDSVPQHKSRMSSAAQWGIVLGTLVAVDLISDGFDLFDGPDVADPSSSGWVTVDSVWIETWSVESASVSAWFVWS